MDRRTASATDRLAVVTGTTRGIGGAVAAGLIERGWHVEGIARHPAPIEHPRYRHILLDLEDSATLADTVERELGTLVADTRWRRVALVNNAAAGGVLGPVETIDPVALLRLSAVNWIAPTWLIGFVPASRPSGYRAPHRQRVFRCGGARLPPAWPITAAARRRCG